MPFGRVADGGPTPALSEGLLSGRRLRRCRAIARHAGWVIESEAGGKTRMPLDLSSMSTSAPESCERDARSAFSDIEAACCDRLVPNRGCKGPQIQSEGLPFPLFAPRQALPSRSSSCAVPLQRSKKTCSLACRPVLPPSCKHCEKVPWNSCGRETQCHGQSPSGPSASPTLKSS